MNLGKRIDKKLEELGWDRKDLMNRVPELSAAALSNLIRRDSKRSEWDERIAEALGVSVMWLVYGQQPYSNPHTVTKLTAQEPSNVTPLAPAPHPAVAEVVDLMNHTDELGKGMILIKVRDIAKERSVQTNKPSSSR